VRQLRAAGAVILGKTAVPEMMLSPSTETVSFGATHNPWDLAYTPGGSSGGSGAAVAAGLAPIALGSDGAGSIRIPAGWCGLFGLKPQRDRVPIAPHDDAWLGLSVNGPLTRTVEDAALFLDVTNTGKTPRGGFVKAAARKPGRLRIALSAKLPTTMVGRVGLAQQRALDGVESLLRELGHEVFWRDPDYPAWAVYGHVLPRMWRGVHDDVQKLPYPERLEPRTRAIARLGGLISDSQIEKVRAAEPALAARYTWAHRLVAVVSDGSAVLGLGDIGPSASLPVMEGKAALFKTFGGLDSIPIVLDTKDPDEIVETLIRLRPSFGAVNLEDISAPRCFEIERRVIEALDCPVMHDDQHGTAIVLLAALLGATKVLGRDMSSLKMVISGAGAAGVACANILLTAGLADITMVDSKGIVHSGRGDLNDVKAELATRTNPEGRTGAVAEALAGADVFLGLSAGKVAEESIAAMAPGGVVFACSNPEPEIHPEVAKRYAAIVATGRSDFPNQINNVLAFPGVFRGALDAGARRITEKMKVAAAEAIFSVVGDDLAADHIVPSPLDPRVGPAVAAAVAAAAQE